MAKDKYYGKTLRKNFARHEEIMPMPNLLEIQKTSYQWFLDTGLREVFADVGVISDYAGTLELSFVDYSMDEPPKYGVEECKARDVNYAAPLKVSVRLRNKETEEIKEQEIFMGDFPLMTIARAMVENAPMLILDEATSSVDTRTEIQIQRAMNKLTEGRTSFVIAHRLSTIRDADMILYMQDGDIREMGTHTELLAKNGLYAKLYNSQFEQAS